MALSVRDRFSDEFAEVGRYLTDGLRLYRIHAVITPNVLLEDVAHPDFPCSWWPVKELVERGDFSLVRPESP